MPPRPATVSSMVALASRMPVPVNWLSMVVLLILVSSRRTGVMDTRPLVALGVRLAAAPVVVPAAAVGGVVVGAGSADSAVAGAPVTDEAVTVRDSLVQAPRTRASTTEDMARHFVTRSLPLIAARACNHRPGRRPHAGCSTAAQRAVVHP